MTNEEKFKIRSMIPGEEGRIADLVNGLQRHQKMKHCPRLPSEKNIRDETIRSDSDSLIPNNNNTFVAVAIDQSRLSEPKQAYLVGYLIYSQVFSIIHGRYFWVNSFFIEEAYRRHGLGGKLMEYVRIHGISAKNDLVDIPYMNDNAVGQKFYANYGAFKVNEEYQLMAISQLD